MAQYHYSDTAVTAGGGGAGSDTTAIHSTDVGGDQRIETIHMTAGGEIKVTY